MRAILVARPTPESPQPHDTPGGRQPVRRGERGARAGGRLPGSPRTRLDAGRARCCGERSELAPHGHAVAAVLVHAREPVLLVEREQGLVVAADAEAERAMALRLRALEERVQERVADAATPAARDDGDRELRRLLVDEAVA